MSSRTGGERVKLWRVPALPQLELMRATYVQQRFARHAHEGFAVGVIESGALGFLYRGENVVAARGAVNLANPDEPHTGHAAVPEGWTYRMFYLPAEGLKQAACQIAGRRVPLPFFPAGVIQDDALAATIRGAHVTLEDDGVSTLEKESVVLLMLSRLIRRYADAPPVPLRIGNERTPVQRARDYIEAHCTEDVSIRCLAAVARLSPYHFIRVFRQELGLPPHSYLKQVRVRRARRLLSLGWSISAAALETGFVDQSHLARNFKQVLGFTPGQFRNFVQYGSPQHYA